MKQIKHLAVELDKCHNDMIEEALSDLLVKYGKQEKKQKK
jgi:hypothetical protein